jgi:hypothetical protein
MAFQRVWRPAACSSLMLTFYPECGPFASAGRQEGSIPSRPYERAARDVMTVCVLDASFVFPWLFEDEASPEADAMLVVHRDRKRAR